MVQKENLNITRDEFDKINEAMKKEEFRKLLMEYAEELSDPVKRKVMVKHLLQTYLIIEVLLYNVWCCTLGLNILNGRKEDVYVLNAYD